MRVKTVKINWNPKLSIYSSESFLENTSDEYGWIGGFNSTGRLICILPFSVISFPLFRFIRFTTQTIWLKEELNIEEEKNFLGCAIEYLRSTGADMIIPATFNSVFRTYPKEALAAPYGSYILDLKQDEERLWKNLHSKHRNVIRSAMKKGVKIHCGPEYLRHTFQFVKDAFKRSAGGFIAKLGVDFRMDYGAFKKQVRSFGKNAKIFIAEFEGDYHCGAVIPYSQFSAYYMHGGGIPKPLTGAMNLLQWEAIKAFKDLGVNYYDFFGARKDPEKGSKIEGIMRFKKRFGGKLVYGYMWKYIFKPLKCTLYSKAVRMRSGGDIVDKESHKL